MKELSLRDRQAIAETLALAARIVGNVVEPLSTVLQEEQVQAAQSLARGIGAAFLMLEECKPGEKFQAVVDRLLERTIRKMNMAQIAAPAPGKVTS